MLSPGRKHLPRIGGCHFRKALSEGYWSQVPVRNAAVPVPRLFRWRLEVVFSQHVSPRSFFARIARHVQRFSLFSLFNLLRESAFTLSVTRPFNSIQFNSNQFNLTIQCCVVAERQLLVYVATVWRHPNSATRGVAQLANAMCTFLTRPPLP